MFREAECGNSAGPALWSRASNRPGYPIGHTALALEFMDQKFLALTFVYPEDRLYVCFGTPQ